MTPYAFQILLHYYWSPEDWDGPSRGNALHREIMTKMLQDDLLNFATDGREFQITERGRAFIDHALSTPLPEKVWVRGKMRDPEECCGE